MVDADDFDVESLRALLRGDAPQPAKPEAVKPKTVKAKAPPKKVPADKTKTGKAAPARAKGKAPGAGTKKRRR